MKKGNDEIRQMEAVARAKVSVTMGQVRTRQRVERQLREYGGNRLALMGKWEQTLRPSSALTYAHTLMRGTKPTREEKEVLDCWRKEAAVGCSRRALVASPADIQAVRKTAAPDVAWTVWLMWLSASRHADIRQAIMTWVEATTLRLQWRLQKSDRFGTRNLTKFIAVEKGEARRVASYEAVLRAMKKQKAELTAHSIRRGAMTALAEQGFEMSEICELSGHTPTQEGNLAVRRYVDPSAKQPEPRRQRKMSVVLRQLADGSGRPTPHL